MDGVRYAADPISVVLYGRSRGQIIPVMLRDGARLAQKLGAASTARRSRTAVKGSSSGRAITTMLCCARFLE
jgi:hypothetical protein